MRLLFFSFLALSLPIETLSAKPLLENSQQTYAGACLEGDASSERLVEICEAGLAESGASAQQRQDILLELAESLNDIGEQARAEAVLGELLAANEDVARAWAIKGWISWQADVYDEAYAHFERSLSLAPTAEALAGLASSARFGDLLPSEEVLTLYDAALSILPNYTWVLREKGWTYIDLNQPELSEEQFRAALEHDESDPYTRHGLGYALNEQDRFAEALEVLRTSADDPEGPPGALSQRSLAWFYTGRYKNALEDAERFLALRPDSDTGAVRRARALSWLGRREEAISSLRAFLSERSSDFVVYWLADLLYDEGEVSQALTVLERNFEAGDADKYDMEFRALLLVDLEDYTGARRALSEAVEAFPESSYVPFYLARVEVAEGNFDAAEQAMEKAVELGLPEGSVREFLAALASRGEYIRMIRWRLAYRERGE